MRDAVRVHAVTLNVHSAIQSAGQTADDRLVPRPLRSVTVRTEAAAVSACGIRVRAAAAAVEAATMALQPADHSVLAGKIAVVTGGCRRGRSQLTIF